MKMVKSLLLVSAAGLVAASGAQAADLPVKAKPVEYVKVCSLYGAGFYYIPGTDICMKIGGYVRFQQNFGTTDVTGGPFTGVGALNNSVASQDQSYRTRWLLTHDTRQQTAYGTLRTYMIIGMSQDSGTDGTAATPPVTQAGGGAVRLYSTRAFIQIAGFTFGKATSFFDFFSTAAVAYQAGSMSAPDTGDGGHVVAAYTAQLGNGISATISAEQERSRGTRFAGAGTAFAADLAGAQATGINALQDIVANVRIDQAWGSAQLAVAAHNASGSYFGIGTPAAGSTGTFENNGRPGNKWGWAVTGGLRLNAPMIGPGDYFQIAAVYAKGATRYASNSPGSLQSRQGQGYAFQFADDAVFTGTALVPGVFQLTTAFSVSASYEHFWTPALRTSIYGSFFDISRSDLGNNALCAGVSGAGTSIIGTITGVGVATSRAAGCDLDSSYWVVGSRSQWNVTKDLYVGLDVVYSKLNTARLNAAGTVNLSSANGINGNTGPFLSRDQNALSVAWRIHRDIVP